MSASKSRLLRRGILPLMVLVVMIPAVGIVSATLLDSSLLPWFGSSNASETASAGPDQTKNGAFVPLSVRSEAGGNGSIWLPMVAGDVD